MPCSNPALRRLQIQWSDVLYNVNLLEVPKPVASCINAHVHTNMTLPQADGSHVSRVTRWMLPLHKSTIRIVYHVVRAQSVASKDAYLAILVGIVCRLLYVYLKQTWCMFHIASSRCASSILLFLLLGSFRVWQANVLDIATLLLQLFVAYA